MKNAFNFISLLLIGFLVSLTNISPAGESTGFNNSNPKRIPNQALQEHLRAGEAWQAYVAKYNTWRVHYNEQNGKPHRAYGMGIPT
ncbi:MAG: hypothetical protein JKX73_02300, partial [Flavobacteriales bacterium]|nr:hypothetical protein [Flavobacteriales bacterium]